MSSSNLGRKEDSSLIDFIDSVSPIYIDGHSQVSPRPRRYICHRVARISPPLPPVFRDKHVSLPTMVEVWAEGEGGY